MKTLMRVYMASYGCSIQTLPTRTWRTLTQPSLRVVLDELALVDGPDSQLSLHRGDERRPLEQGSGQTLQSLHRTRTERAVEIKTNKQTNKQKQKADKFTVQDQPHRFFLRETRRSKPAHPPMSAAAVEHWSGDEEAGGERSAWGHSENG